jgi:hypothetical protein
MQGIKLLLLLLLAMNVQAEEKAVYIGEGRYACEGDSVECVVLKQRNREQTRRAQERDEDKRRYERSELRESEYRREYESRRY